MIIGHDYKGLKKRGAAEFSSVSSTDIICAAPHPSPTNVSRNELAAKGASDRENIKNQR